MHGQEPPPVAILEKLTAKGGDTLGRTIENFQPPEAQSEMINGAGDSEGEGSRTPKEAKMDIDEPSSGGRVTRGELVKKWLDVIAYSETCNARSSSSTSS